MNVILKQDKFHTIIFKKIRVSKLDPKKQTLRNLLCYYQELACQKYDSEAYQSTILGYFYDTKFSVSTSTFGKYTIIEYVMNSVDPKFIDDNEYTIEALEELFEDLCDAKLDGKGLDEELFLRAYEIYESDLNSRLDRLSSLAIKKALDFYFTGTERMFDSYGSLDELTKISSRDLYEYYLEVLNEETFSIGTGDFSLITNNNYTLTPKKDYFFTDRNSVADYHYEHSKGKQCYLEVIYELGVYASNSIDYYNAVIFNHIFGGSSSLLFDIVREKNGLCYNISSRYYGASGIILVSAVINYEDMDKVLAAIDEALNTIKNRDFSVEDAKEYYLSNLKTNNDLIYNLLDYYIYDNYFLDSPKSSDEFDFYSKVNIDGVYDIASRMKRTLVYAYGGKKND